MGSSEIILSFISIIGTLSSILFAYLAFSRNKKNDVVNNERFASQQQIASNVDIATIKIDLKYTRDAVDRIGNRLDVIEKIQNKAGENIIKINEHLLRSDDRLDKLEKRFDKFEKIYKEK